MLPKWIKRIVLAILAVFPLVPDVGHAFVSEDNYNQPGPAGDAWAQTLIFLEKNLMSND